MTNEMIDKVLNRNKMHPQVEIDNIDYKALSWQANLLNNSREACIAWDVDGTIVYWNKGAETLYGYAREEACGCVIHKLLKTVDFDDENKLNSILDTGGVWRGNIVHTRKDGARIIIASCQQIAEGENGSRIVFETNRDITEHVGIKGQIKRQKDELEAIIQSIDDAVFIYDANKSYYLADNSAKEFFSESELSDSGEALEGSITVESEVGKGSTFTVFLPVEAKAEASIENELVDLLDNRLVQSTNVEFSDIYL